MWYTSFTCESKGDESHSGKSRSDLTHNQGREENTTTPPRGEGESQHDIKVSECHMDGTNPAAWGHAADSFNMMYGEGVKLK